MLPPDFLHRLAAHRPPPAERLPARRAAVAAVLRVDEADASTDGCGVIHVLLMRRVEHPRDPWSGHVSFPGGTQEPGDADLLATAVRETHEEVGIDLSADARLICPLAPITAMGRGVALDMDITPFVFVLERPRPLRVNDEVAHAFWFPLARAAAGEFDADYPYVHGRITRVLPCWRFDDQVVWGLTYRMLHDLLRIARDDPG